MTEFKWELPMWCPAYGQVSEFSAPDWCGDRRVRFSANDFGPGLWSDSTGKINIGGDDARLRNGIMTGNSFELEGAYRYLVIGDGVMDSWQELADASYFQRENGGVIIDLTKVGPEAFVQPRRKISRWVNFHSDDVLNCGDTREDADRFAGDDRIACIEVTFTEGEGL